MTKDKSMKKDFKYLLMEIYTSEDMSLIVLKATASTIGRMDRTIEDSFCLECAMEGEFGK